MARLPWWLKTANPRVQDGRLWMDIAVHPLYLRWFVFRELARQVRSGELCVTARVGRWSFPVTWLFLPWLLFRVLRERAR